MSETAKRKIHCAMVEGNLELAAPLFSRHIQAEAYLMPQRLLAENFSTERLDFLTKFSSSCAFFFREKLNQLISCCL
jgi:hypothetical protein